MTREKTPKDLTITPRDRRFGRGSAQARWWLGGDPIATAFYNALSVTFPRGEAFFIESVRAFRAGAAPKLSAEIAAFIKQEVMHGREHIAFNARVCEAGYEIAPLDDVVRQSLELTRNRPAILNLAVTMALEHYTAIMAQRMLTDARAFAGADPDLVAMWQWHAIEEIEHKGVAYDTWRHATREWTRGKRWRVKTLMMLLVTREFWRKRFLGMLFLLKQDGIEGPRAWARVLWYWFGAPGVVRKLVPAWAAFFLPGFHPWNRDDRALIALVDSDYADAVLPGTAMA